MKTLRFLFLLLCAAPLFAFDWPGGTMNVPVTFRGTEVFAGWVPSSPWGAVSFVWDPVVELHNQQNDVVAEFSLTGGTMDWYEGSTRAGVASFTAAAGAYSITTRPGRRLVRIPGEGYSGFELAASSIVEPVASVPPPSSGSLYLDFDQNSGVTDGSGAVHHPNNSEKEVDDLELYPPASALHGEGDSDGNAWIISATVDTNRAPGDYLIGRASLRDGGRLWAVYSIYARIHAAANTPPSVTLLAPQAQTVVAGTTLTLTARATDPDGNITGHNLDIQRPAGDWNWQGGVATGEPYQGAPVGSGADSTRSAAFTFSDVGTYHVRSAADDGSGWQHSETVAVTVVAPPPQYALLVSAGAGGSAVGGGLYASGASAVIRAVPDATHDFSGWSGDAGGAANPLTVLMDRAKTVQANFAPKLHVLTTSATPGGSVTPGGSYPHGTSVTIAAVPDVLHRFVGWSGDASGATPSVMVTLTRALSVQAVFADKSAQWIDFLLPGSVPVGSAPLELSATASSGLPVGFSVVSGPASLAGGRLTISGPGPIVVQATQPGDGVFLPAAPVNRTFNAVSAAIMRYRPMARTTFHGSDMSSAPLVLERP